MPSMCANHRTQQSIGIYYGTYAKITENQFEGKIHHFILKNDPFAFQYKHNLIVLQIPEKNEPASSAADEPNAFSLIVTELVSLVTDKMCPF